MKTSSGPITVTVKEGMVTIAERTYRDSKKARAAGRAAYWGWPNWMLDALRRVERNTDTERPS